jgi:hypothetical protein
MARLCVRDLDARRRSDYLSAVGWPGDTGQLNATIAEVGEHWVGNEHLDEAVLHLDVGRSEVGAKLGLEYHFERLPQLRGELAETGFLSYLEQRGLCSASKHQALLSWPGYQVKTLKHELWPSLITRRVNHLKLVFDHQHLSEIKCYLCVTHSYHQDAGSGAGAAQAAGGQ